MSSRPPSRSSSPHPAMDAGPLRSITAAVRRAARRSMRRVILGVFAFIAANLLLLVRSGTDVGGFGASSLGFTRTIQTVFGEPELPKFLWSYIPGIDETIDTPASVDVWTWINSQRRKGYRRPSWGALAQQGPKAHIRDNLKQGQQYLTLFQGGDGWNNQVIAAGNNVLLAMKSGRIPILSPFLPAGGHLGGESNWLSVMEVFDFTDFIAETGVPVIDMLELKTPWVYWYTTLIANRHKRVVYDGEFPQRRPTKPVETIDGEIIEPDTSAGEWLVPGEVIPSEKGENDVLKCWSSTMSQSTDDGGVNPYPLSPTEIEFTPLPRSAFHEYAHNYAWVFTNGTADVINSYSKVGDQLPQWTIDRLVELDRPPSTMQPDDQITCVDRGFFMHTMPNSEIRSEWRTGVGAWDAVGKHMKFQPGITKLAQDLVRQLLGVPWDEPVPLYLAVHIRRTDLAGEHRDMTQRQWAYMAWEVLHELKKEEGVHVRHILFTTDEKDPEWRNELKKLGWVLVEHSAYNTGSRLDWWLPTILDSAILSASRVFLGRGDSTMSILPYRRVLDWVGGTGRFVDPVYYSNIPEGWEWAEDW